MRLAVSLISLATVLLSPLIASATDDPGAEFFEKRIRPVLVQRCAECHIQGSASKSGLRIESREALLRGGERGAAIVPGDSEASLLIQAVVKDDEAEVQMPPEERLTDDEINDLRHWIAIGAPWPAAKSPTSPLDTNSQHWAFARLTDRPVPNDRGTELPSPIDHFLYEKLNEAGLAPAPPADRRTFIRRATFDLLGLPPTPAEIDAYLADDSPDATERLIDRLLASPHYGERWGRHWLDLVRYAETEGHEFDTDKPNIYRYRDYVIEAFNRDLPYDRFIIEQIAGDVLAEPRLDPDGTHRTSSVATGFLWLGEVQNVPVDPPAAYANFVENQIDVVGKAFLGMTLACARCHDHKFDPVSREDYYGLFGVLSSATKVQDCVDEPDQTERIAAIQQRLAENDRAMVPLKGRGRLAALRHATRAMPDYLTAAAKLNAAGQADDGRARYRVAADAGLDAARLAAWSTFLKTAEENRDPIFYPWTRLAGLGDSSFADRARTLAERLAPRADAAAETTAVDDDLEIFDDFESETFDGWRVVGQAFGNGPSFEDRPELLGVHGRGYVSSYRGTVTLVGRIESRRFVITKPYLHFRIAGGNRPGKTYLALMINDQALPELTATGDGHDRLEWRTFEIPNLIDREAYFAIVDEDSEPGGHILVDRIAFSDGPLPEIDPLPNVRVISRLSNPAVVSARSLADAYANLVDDALAAAEARLQSWHDQVNHKEHQENKGVYDADSATAWWHLEDPAQDAILKWALHTPLLVDDDVDPADYLASDDRARFVELRRERQDLESAMPSSALALVAAEAEPRNARIHFRGNAADLREEVARGFPVDMLAEAIGDPNAPVDSGSGRWELARWITSPDNPLTARVMVNRIWQHHFGRGLVATPDNFGALGEEPSHPALLDYLARRFIESGWSIKAMHRLIMNSAAYQQSSRPDPRALELDPDNGLVHHMPVRRLEAEAIRDAILAMSGRLDRRQFGPSVPLHLTSFMEGRDLPPISGPLDGDGRRSIYLAVRRNHLTPLLAVFDFPKPTTTAGERTTSIVAPQALALLNNQFVVGQAEAWATHILADGPTDPAARVRGMFLEAFGREPSSGEAADALEFLTAQSSRYQILGSNDVELRTWADLCHALLNVSEFRFVR